MSGIIWSDVTSTFATISFCGTASFVGDTSIEIVCCVSLSPHSSENVPDVCVITTDSDSHVFVASQRSPPMTENRIHKQTNMNFFEILLMRKSFILISDEQCNAMIDQ